jgi:hypothetical protein
MAPGGDMTEHAMTALVRAAQARRLALAREDPTWTHRRWAEEVLQCSPAWWSRIQRDPPVGCAWVANLLVRHPDVAADAAQEFANRS